jgi:hypothetical protein
MKPKKKIPTLYASDLLVKEIYQLTRKIDAMGDNISDWREEYYCEHPAGERDALLAAIKRGNADIDKWSKKLDRIETRICKQYGKETLREIDFVFRWKNFGSLKYVEKRKIKLNNF